MVDVHRVPGSGLGVSIVGGKVESPSNNNGHSSPGSPVGGGADTSGIFIKSVLPDSPAGRTGNLFTGDRILEISGVKLVSSDHTAAVSAIKNAGDPVRFVVQSLRAPGVKAATPTTPSAARFTTAASPIVSFLGVSFLCYLTSLLLLYRYFLGPFLLRSMPLIPLLSSGYV